MILGCVPTKRSSNIACVVFMIICLLIIVPFTNFMNLSTKLSISGLKSKRYMCGK